MSYRANVTDRQQDVIENAQFEGGVPVFENNETRVIAKGADGSPERAAHGSTIGSNAGVVMPWNDSPGKFLDSQGKP